MKPQPILEGHGLRLIPMTLDHIPHLWKALQDPSLWAYMPNSMTSLADMESYVKHALVARDTLGEIPFVTQIAQTGEIIGSTRFYEISVQHRRAEIGYTTVSPRWQRTFVNTAAKFLLLSYGFEVQKWHRMALRTDSRNLRSQAAIERIGATREGVLRRHMVMSNGYHRDSVYYSITDLEWESVRLHLLSKLRPEPTLP